MFVNSRSTHTQGFRRCRTWWLLPSSLKQRICSCCRSWDRLKLTVEIQKSWAVRLERRGCESGCMWEQLKQLTHRIVQEIANTALNLDFSCTLGIGMIWSWSCQRDKDMWPVASSTSTLMQEAAQPKPREIVSESGTGYTCSRREQFGWIVDFIADTVSHVVFAIPRFFRSGEWEEASTQDTYHSASTSRLPATSKTAPNAKARNAQQWRKKHEEHLVEAFMYIFIYFIYLIYNLQFIYLWNQFLFKLVYTITFCIWFHIINLIPV